MLKKVYLCSPLGGNVKENLEKVKRYTRFALLCGTAPVVPHYYSLSLDDGRKEEREMGINAGKSLLWFCDELWVFGSNITKGMKDEIMFCEGMKIPVKRISDKKIKKILGGKNK